jgi:sec-independent protein translocase protein TatB
MEILGIGPGEFVLILIVLLVVVGPERLPGLARQAGSLLVRARNWLQTSPDAALVLRARQEIEAELASLKSSLLEVQSVRDEVLGAARQLEDSVSSITSTKIDFSSMIEPIKDQTIAPNGQAAPDVTAPAALPGGDPIASPEPDQPATLTLPDAGSMPIGHPEDEHSRNGAAPAAAPPLAELESINVRLQAIMSDLWALQEQLKQRGALDQGWQPPSWDMQLPAPRPAAAADTPADAAQDAASGGGVPAEPAASPARARKRRAAGAPDPTSTGAAEATASADAQPPAAAKTRKRRARGAPNTSLESADETETVATEEAS